MRKILFISGALLMVNVSGIQAQSVEMQISEFADLEQTERGLFSALLLGMATGVPAAQECLTRWAEGPSEDSWLTTLTETMNDMGVMSAMANASEGADPPAMEVLLGIFLSTCQGGEA